jgi:AIPR protein
MSDSDLADFATQLQQDLLSEASIIGEERMIRDVFVERMVADLAEAGELDDGTACFHQARGVEVSGYNISEDGHLLDLFGVVLTQAAPPPTVSKSAVDTCIRRLRGFLDRARGGYTDREEALPVFDMFLRVNQTWPDISRVRLFIFTDGLTAIDRVAEASVDDIPVSVNVWDLRRLHRLVTSGRQEEPVNIDFISRFGNPIPCLSAEQADSDYQTILAVVPGDVLMDVYGEYGSRLLQLNVRSFLQARGKVNQGIRRTILDEPDRFLAYNNGISATASAVKLTSMPEGGLGIQSLENLQIVNGGQTTASLYHAAVKDRANIDRIQVQMKLTVVKPDRLDEIVPLISRFANSQNKVNEADFSANHPFHVEIEKLSRAIWAPAADGTQRQTRWFYERARGQYQDALSRAGTPARQRQFKEVHPAAQRFAKTDLAKFEMAWDRLPHLVSLGAQKCFREFTIRLTDRADQSVGQSYFVDLIAKAILFRRTEKLVSTLQLGGYRANVVAYVVALLSERSKRHLDLGAIWRHQRLSTSLEEAIIDLAPRVHGILLEAPGNGNVTEWAKKPACWERVHGMAWQLPAAVSRELTSARPAAKEPAEASAEEVAGMAADVWSRLASWAELNNQLTPLDRRIATGMSTLALSQSTPTPKQTETAIRIYHSAVAKGFQADSSV